MSSSVGAVSGQCRGSVGAVAVDTGVGVSSSVGAVSERCRGSVGQCRGFLTDHLLDWRRAVSECRSVGVSECRSVGQCRSVGVSERGGRTSLACRPYEPYSFTQSDLSGKVANVPLAHLL